MVEIGKSIIDDIIYAFYDSSYIDSDNYFETINELVNIFYVYQDKFSDYLIYEEIIINIFSDVFLVSLLLKYLDFVFWT